MSHHTRDPVMLSDNLLSLATQPVDPFESIPVIDISGLSGDPDSKAQVVNAIREACTRVGFFYVKNHGINEAVITSAVDATREFFNLSLEEKMKLDFHKTPNFRGYYPIDQKRYVHECFEIGPEIGVTPNIPMSGLNVWPPQDLVPGFQEATLKYYQEVVKLGLKLFTAFALALNIPEDFFFDKVQKTAACMRVIHYPPQAVVIEKQVTGIRAHTDFECFTILWQDENPALQVLNTSGQWIDAKPMPGTFVINIGDQLSRWTNDIFKSTVHRAINRTGVQRYSIPLFFGTDYEVKIEVLPSCVSESRPALYEPILAGDYVKSRLEKIYASAK